ncbi:hypothetical protein GOP47_0014352 [Adiantum capillus-veneris]|uniref:Uncharacterized protein n=1 Tax=Adiantum capillus-veneris TaxID=13818 RepID=A0A9D4ULC1_ADICA|nr:hypothetical protein GOP47_0014352 [Adiantum capillus-veneris]
MEQLGSLMRQASWVLLILVVDHAWVELCPVTEGGSPMATSQDCGVEGGPLFSQSLVIVMVNHQGQHGKILWIGLTQRDLFPTGTRSKLQIRVKVAE